MGIGDGVVEPLLFFRSFSFIPSPSNFTTNTHGLLTYKLKTKTQTETQTHTPLTLPSELYHQHKHTHTHHYHRHTHTHTSLTAPSEHATDKQAIKEPHKHIHTHTHTPIQQNPPIQLITTERVAQTPVTTIRSQRNTPPRFIYRVHPDGPPLPTPAPSPPPHAQMLQTLR